MQEEPQPVATRTRLSDKIVFTAYVNNVKTLVTIDEEKLTAGPAQILVYDMVGLLQVFQGKQENTYSLNHFPKKKKLFKSERRYIQSFVFAVKHEQPGWHQKQPQIIELINNRSSSEPTKILICFNPNAGSNSTKSLTRILGFISHTNLQYEILETQHRNHCLQHLKTIDPSQYCAVAIVSGDGLIHEYVNSFCPVPLTHVPAGSGNAFAKNQTFRAGELCQEQESIFLVVKNNRRKFNIVKYELNKHPEPVYSFLSLEWAILADVDINSEFLRVLGVLRFEVYAVWRNISVKRYKGRISYSTIQSEAPSLETDLRANPNYITLEDDFLYAMFCNLPFISSKHQPSPLLSVGQRSVDMQLVGEKVGRWQMTKFMLSFESGKHFDREAQRPTQGFKFDHAKVKSFRVEALDPQQPGAFVIDGQAYEGTVVQGSLSDRTFEAFT